MTSDSSGETQEDIGRYTHDSSRLRNRAAMVLFTLEQSLGAYVRENATDINDLPHSQVSKHIAGDGQQPSVADIIQGTYISEIIDLAISVARFNSDKPHLSHLKVLADSLKLYDIRNAVCHPNRPFPECFWHRLSALVTDPALEFLQLQDVQQSFFAAIQDRITLPSDDWFRDVGFELDNNLPDTFDHDITGFIGRNKERSDLLKRLKNRKLNLLALVGVGGTGKTALALDVLHELVLDPATSEWVDEIVYVSAKTERLTKDGPVPIDDPLETLAAVKETLVAHLSAEHELSVAGFEELASRLADRRLLVCIDNLETLLRDHEESFDDLYAEMPENWRVLVTSRVPVNSATVITLDPMQTQAANHLARQYLIRRGGDATDGTLLQRIVTMADANPLAIRVCIDGFLAGVELEESLQNTRSTLLEFSYKNLLRVLPADSNQVLECLFATGERLSRSDMCTLLDVGIDQIASGLNALLKTSLVLRHPDEAEEKYSLSSSVHELLLRQPVDEAIRESVMERLASRRSAISAIKAQTHADDPLDDFHIAAEASETTKVKAYEAFRAIRRRSSKSDLVTILSGVQRSLEATPDEGLLYRTAACLFFELNDRTSAEQMLHEAEKRKVLDPAGRLLLAEYKKDCKDFEGCKAVSRPLLDEGWLCEGRTSRANLVRLAHVTWLVAVWTGDALTVASETRAWRDQNDLRGTMGCMHVTAIRRLLERERDSGKTNGYCQEILKCLSELLSAEGYLGFLAKEALECLRQIALFQDKNVFRSDTREIIVEFVQQHFRQICAVHREVTLGDEFTTRLLDNVALLEAENGQSSRTVPTVEPLADDERLSEYGYVTVEIYHWPVDHLGNRRSFCFAKSASEDEYYVSRRAMRDSADFDRLSEGDRLSVRPKSEYDEGKAIPVADAMRY